MTTPPPQEPSARLFCPLEPTPPPPLSRDASPRGCHSVPVILVSPSPGRPSVLVDDRSCSPQNGLRDRVTNLSWFSRDVPGLSTKSPSKTSEVCLRLTGLKTASLTSKKPPRSWANWIGCFLYSWTFWSPGQRFKNLCVRPSLHRRNSQVKCYYLTIMGFEYLHIVIC